MRTGFWQWPWYPCPKSIETLGQTAQLFRLDWVDLKAGGTKENVVQLMRY